MLAAVSHGRGHKSAPSSSSAHVCTRVRGFQRVHGHLFRGGPPGPKRSMLFNYQRPKVPQIDAAEEKKQRERERLNDRGRERETDAHSPPPASDVPLGLINPVKSHLFTRSCPADWSASSVHAASKLETEERLTNQGRAAAAAL